MMTRISSPANPRFKVWKQLAAGRVRKHGLALVSGHRICREVATDVRVPKVGWLVPAGHVEDLPGDPGIPRFEVAPALFRQVDVFGTSSPLLEVSIDGFVRPLPAKLGPGIYLCLPFQDPVNVGAALRSARGLGAAGALLLPTCASPFHPRSLRASAGAAFQLPLCELPNVTRAHAAGLRIVALESRGRHIKDYSFPEHVGLLPGMEGRGLDGLAQRGGFESDMHVTMDRVSLPMDHIESYNAGVALSLALYEWRRRQEA